MITTVEERLSRTLDTSPALDKRRQEFSGIKVIWSKGNNRGESVNTSTAPGCFKPPDVSVQATPTACESVFVEPAIQNSPQQSVEMVSETGSPCVASF